MREARKNDQIVMLGVIQEQHAERCRLFAQWQQFEWPIVQDPINRLGLTAVPIVVELDQQGIVRSVRPSVKDVLASLESDQQTDSNVTPAAKAGQPAIAELKRTAEESGTSQAWMELGDALVLWGDPSSNALIETDRESRHRTATAAIAAYKRALSIEPDQAELHFRLGVAYRKRHDALQKDRTDFQSAVDHWGQALELNPNQYIYRRRIQQYGPRLIKPYPFYDWVNQARSEITARGEKPIELAVEPSGAEFASPTKRFASSTEQQKAPDPQGRIRRDQQGLIDADVVVVPGAVQPGESVRVHVQLQPSANAVWNNESEPLILWLELPDGWQSQRQWFAASMPDHAESSEPRRFDFEIKTPESTTGDQTLKAYALYYVCESRQGTCLYLRQDIEVSVRIQP